MLIAIPSNKPGGLDARVSPHFGRCDIFTLVKVDDDQIGEVTTLDNAHEPGACGGTVARLQEAGVTAVVAGHMGMRPMQGLVAAGMGVHAAGEAESVREAVQGFIEGVCPEMGEEHSCSHHGHGHEHGHEGCGHGHGGGGGCGHHQHIERKTVDGPVEKDRVVFVSLRVSDEAGELIDETTDGIGFLFGHGAMVPGLEAALDGKVAGDKIKVTLGPKEAYGERDEERLIKAPADNLPPELKPGDTVQAQLHSGGIARLTLVSVEDGEATLDANHPLAGQTLTFEAEVLEIQEAAPEDLEAAGE